MGRFEENYFEASKLKDDIILSVTANYLEGGKAVSRHLKKDPVNPKKKNIIQVSSIVAESIKGVTADMSKRIRIEIRESLLAGETKEQLKRRLDSIFKGENPTRFRYEQRLDTIARTETTRALSQGGLDTAQELGATRKWLLMIDDSRTSDVSKAFHKKYGTPKQAIPIDEEFVATVGGKTYRGLTTPLHINDRDTVIYEF